MLYGPRQYYRPASIDPFHPGGCQRLFFRVRIRHGHPQRLKRLAEDGDNRARKLLDKLDHPSRFLATVQAGVTLCGLFAAGLVCDRFAGVAVNALAGHGIASPRLLPLEVL